MDNVDRWLGQLRKGVVELLILRLLTNAGELHGYAIVKELLSRSGFSSGESTVYPVLRRLEADRLLTSRWSEAGNGPPRKYYKVSEAGRTFMRRAAVEWDGLVESMARLTGGEGNE